MANIQNLNLSELLRLKPGLDCIYSDNSISYGNCDYLDFLAFSENKRITLKEMLVILRKEIQVLQFRATKKEVPGIQFVLKNLHLFYSDVYDNLNVMSKEIMFRATITSKIQTLSHEIWDHERQAEGYFQPKMKVVHSPA